MKRGDSDMRNIWKVKENAISGTLLIFIITASSLIWSCEKYSFAPPGIDDSKEYSFSADIEPIFKGCAGCHPSVSQPDLGPGKAYQSLVDGGYIDKAKPEESKLLKKLHDGHAGINSSSPKYVDILGWITQGAKKN
jgi:hypothetical protein